MPATEETQDQPNVLSFPKGSFRPIDSFAADNCCEIKNTTNKAHGTDHSTGMFSEILPHSPLSESMTETAWLVRVESPLFSFYFFNFLKILLEYSCFTMLC